MNHKVKKIIADLKNNIEGVDKEYIDILTDNFKDYASAVLTLNYYILYETGYEESKYNTPELLKYIEEVNGVIEEYVVKDNKVDDSVITRVDNIRNLVIDKLDLLLNYTAKLYIYEYILNRLEYNFEKPLENGRLIVNDDNFAKQVVDYIFSNNDNVVISGKIREVIAQLPIRMTKDRFYGLISDAMTLYKGNKVDELDMFVEKIESAATLSKEAYDEEYKVLIDALEYYNGVDFKNINAETFDVAKEKYREVNDFVRTYTDFLSDLQRSINMTYVLLLVKQIRENVGLDNLEVEDIRKNIIKHLCECFKSEYKQSIDDNITSDLTCVEGVQEKSHTLIMQLEQVIDEDILEIYAKEDNRISEIITSFKKCSLLTSTSIFAAFEQKQINNTEVDDAIIQDRMNKLIEQFKELFSSKPKMYTRAVMANILSELPIFFTNMTEVVDYVHTQIAACKNENEKIACYAILTDMMADDDIKWDFNI